MIEARGLYHRYDVHRPVLVDIDLEVAAGGSVAVVGPSGSGKSTLLHCLAGLEAPTRGTLAVCGVALHQVGAAGRRTVRRTAVGLVVQDGQLLPELDVLDNVALPLRLCGVRASLAREQAREGLGRLGLGDLVDRSVGELSGGQYQRVAVARALAHRPALVLADEPTGALDSRNRVVVVDFLLAAVEQFQATLIMVTHDPVQADRCERSISLVDGRLVSC